MMNSSFDDDDPFNPNNNPFRSPTQQQQQQMQEMSDPFAPVPHQPDPNSGMMGTFQMPQQQRQPQPLDPTLYLSGTMDQKNKTMKYNTGAAGASGSDEIPSSPFSAAGGWLRFCCRLDSYKEYFNVDTVDITGRLYAALTDFYKPDYFRVSVLGDKGPDLYGPVWISMTLIFLLAVSSNLSAYMHHIQRIAKDDTIEEEFNYDIHHLLRAGTIVAIFSLGVPAAFWLTTSCLLAMPGVTPLVMWICCYGYAQLPIAVAACIVWVPFGLVQWIVLAMACTAGVLLIVRNLATLLLTGGAENAEDPVGNMEAADGNHAAKAAPILLAVLATHFIYLLVLKFTFYR